MPRRSPRTKEPGIRRHGAGWQANVRVNGHLYHSPTFPLETPVATMRLWREQQRAAYLPSRRGSFAADVARYLATVRHMPTYRERERHLHMWLGALGHDRPRATITRDDIAAQLSAWRTEPRHARADRFAPKAPSAAPLSATTVRHLRTALLSLYHALDGKRTPCPVDETERPLDPEPVPSAVGLGVLARVFGAMQPSATRARLMVLMATGMPHASLMRLTPDAVDLPGREVRMPARKKGRGAGGRRLRLSEAGVAAFRELIQWEAWGAFSSSSMRAAWHRACRRAGVPPFRPYALRHTIGALLYQESRDLPTVQRVLGHADMRTTSRYAADAVAELDARAIDTTGAKVSAVFAPQLPEPQNER